MKSVDIVKFLYTKETHLCTSAALSASATKDTKGKPRPLTFSASAQLNVEELLEAQVQSDLSIWPHRHLLPRGGRNGLHLDLHEAEGQALPHQVGVAEGRGRP